MRSLWRAQVENVILLPRQDCAPIEEQCAIETVHRYSISAHPLDAERLQRRIFCRAPSSAARADRTGKRANKKAADRPFSVPLSVAYSTGSYPTVMTR